MPIRQCLEKRKRGRVFWLSGVALVLVGGVGLVGNVLTLLVLIKSHLRKKPFFKLLITLALYDLLFIVSYGTILGYRALACHPNSRVTKTPSARRKVFANPESFRDKFIIG